MAARGFEFPQAGGPAGHPEVLGDSPSACGDFVDGRAFLLQARNPAQLPRRENQLKRSMQG